MYAQDSHKKESFLRCQQYTQAESINRIIEPRKKKHVPAEQNIEGRQPNGENKLSVQGTWCEQQKEC